MASKCNIPLHGPSVNIVRQCRSVLSDVVQSKFGCVATIEGVDFEDQSIVQQKGPTVVPEERFTVTLPAGVKVSVWKGDLTNFKVEAVVNAANDRLQHYGGLALALSNTGGSQIQKDSNDYIQKHGNLKTGDAIVMAGGLLPCKMIIHAVGPQLEKRPLQSEVSSAERLLKKAIRSILDRVEENHLQSVAIPAISSGLFNYPLPQCAETIVKTVKQYYDSSLGKFPEKIFLVNNDEPTVKEMEKACRQILATSERRGGVKTSAPAVQIGNVHVRLKKGRIEEEWTDVIVNTASASRDLRNGKISSALLQKAGYELQRELYKASMTGRVFITKPHKLQCKQVYHTSCIDKGSDTRQHANAQQILYSSVFECLQLAAQNHHKSIAFPAIGTGGLGFDTREAAGIMSHAVVQFARTSPMKMEVYFVIFPSNEDTYKAFEQEIGDLQATASHHSPTPALMWDLMSSPPAHERRDDYHGSRGPTPQISLSSPSDERTREADQWLQGLLFESSGAVLICNNFILHFGQREHQHLSRLIKQGVTIDEHFVNGCASITVNGNTREGVVVAGLQVEALLCNIQKEFVREEEHVMLQISMKNASFERKTVDDYSSRTRSALKKLGLRLLKVDKVENPTLKELFDLKKNQLCCFTPQRMYQRVSAQFCEMVCRIGFHAQYAPPEDPAYGEGIYFAGTVEKAMEIWKEPDSDYQHFVEAEVLTGKSTAGKPGLILPPTVGSDPQILFDSVSGGPDVSVIFSGYQALPKYIYITRKC